jgi:hypothetical protein
MKCGVDDIYTNLENNNLYARQGRKPKKAPRKISD